MKTIQLTLDEPLLAEVDRVTAELHTTRSAFVREALQAALRRYRIETLERQHRLGYEHHPVQPAEFDVWLTEQVWNDEAR